MDLSQFPLLYSEKEFEYLKGTYVGKSLQAYKDEWTSIYKFLKDKLPKEFKFSQEDYFKA